MSSTHSQSIHSSLEAIRSGTPELELNNISAFYDDAQVLHAVDLKVHTGEVVALLGSNGAGKTTLLRTITGLLKPREGSIVFKGIQIAGLPVHQVIRLGIASVPEGRQLFGDLSVSDNLLLGTYWLNRNERSKMTRTRLKKVFDLFPVLNDRRKQQSSTLSGGEQQMLALGRALMANPKLLVLDEPSLGLSPIMVNAMMKLLKVIGREIGISILLVEQNARAAIKIADYIYVLEQGAVTVEGPTSDVICSQQIQSAYLGRTQETCS